MKFALKTLSFALSLSFAGGAAWAEGLGILHVGDQETWLLSAQGNLRVSTSQGIAATWRRTLAEPMAVRAPGSFDMVTANAAPVSEAEIPVKMLAGQGLVGLMATRRRKA